VTQPDVDALVRVRRSLRDELVERVDVRGLERVSRTERRLRVREEALAILRRQGHMLPQRSLAKVVNEVSDEVVGFGPVEFLLKDPGVTEVMVNGADDVYVERKGRIERAPEGLFEGEEAVLHLIERIVGPLGIRVDESSPWADARLPDGSRVQTGFLRTPFAGGQLGHLFRDAVETPAIGNALQLVLDQDDLTQVLGG
jgi:pilus assembly protein CpaF